MRSPSLSVVIPALNEEAYVGRALRSIREQDYAGEVQIIVVDGGSTDRTLQIVHDLARHDRGIEVMNAGKGISLARNTGAARARHELLLFLDADMMMPRGFLQSMTAHIPEDIDFVALASHKPISKNIFDYVFTYSFFLAVYIFRRWHPICSGSFLLTTRTNHKKIGGFDERLRIMGEDVDYGRRSIANGARYIVWLSPQIHASPRRLHEMGRWRLAWRWMSGYWYMLFVGPLYENSGFVYSFGSHKPERRT